MNPPSNYTLGGQWAREHLARDLRELIEALLDVSEHSPSTSDAFYGLLAGLTVAAEMAERGPKR